MKPDIRWQLLFAATGFVLVLGILSLQVQTQSLNLCTVTVPTAGGSYVEGMVGKPRGLNPLLSDGYPAEEDLTSLIFDGLTQVNSEGEYIPALAENWAVSEDGLTVRFALRDDVVWHDGEPFDSADVVATYGLMQDDAFPGREGLKRLWQSVQINAIDERTVEFVLTEPYAGFMAETTRGILPAHEIESIAAADLASAEFNQQPIGTGPFMVANDDWAETHLLTLEPNPEAWQPEPQIDSVVIRFFGDEETLVAAFEAGEIQAINQVTPSLLPAVAELENGRLFTAETPRITSLIFNLSETGSPATQNQGVRRALALGLDREALIDSALNGQGVVQNGPYLPSSWAYNSELITDFPFDPANADVGLADAGWNYPEGNPMRQNGETPLNLRLLLLDTPTNQALAAGIAAQWAKLGVGVTPTPMADWTTFREALAARNFDVALVDIKPPADPDLYDFWSQEAIVRGQNYAGWNSRRASEALEAGRKLWTEAERKPFYDTFLQLYNEALPELTLFHHVSTYAATDSIDTLDIGKIDQPRDRYTSLPFWFLAEREVPVACSAETATPPADS